MSDGFHTFPYGIHVEQVPGISGVNDLNHDWSGWGLGVSQNGHKVVKYQPDWSKEGHENVASYNLTTG